MNIRSLVRRITGDAEARRRLAVVEQNLRELNAAAERLVADQRRIEDRELPGLLALAERRVAARLADSEHAVAVSARAHTEQAVAAAERTAIEVARAHAESAATAAEQHAVDAARVHAEAAAAVAEQRAVEVARVHAEAAAVAARDDVLVAIRAEQQAATAKLTREIASARRSASAAGAPTGGAVVSGAAAAGVLPPVDDALYAALEDRFRGDPALITARQRRYLELVGDAVDADHPALDLGCGRGEWLRILAAEGVPAEGVDSNPTFVAAGVEAGLAISEGDLVSFLRTAPDQAYGMVTMFQVVEHLPFPVLVDVLRECARVLRPGGVFAAETPNGSNLRVAASTFWLDPTHERPLHPELLQFLAVECGFVRADGWFLHDLGGDTEAHADATVERLRQLVDGPGDFTLLAWV